MAKKKYEYDKYLENKEFENHVNQSTKEAKREIQNAANSSRSDSIINDRDENPGLAYALIKGSVAVFVFAGQLGFTAIKGLATGVGNSVNLLLRLINNKNKGE